jgi:hypothetical protein
MVKVIAAVALLIPLSSWHCAAESKKAKYVKVDNLPFVWPNSDSEASRITKSQVISLLRSITEAMLGAGEGEWEDVETFTFVTLDDSGLYLVAVSDSSPAKWFHEMQVVKCQGNTCSSSWIESTPPNDLNRQIVALSQDGKHQVLGWKSLRSGGSQSEHNFLYIYGISDGKVEDESAKYPEYYRVKVLPSYTKEAQELTPNEHYTEEMVEKDRAKLLYAQEDVERRVFGDRMAGLSDAKQWEQSSDEDIKDLAIQTFEKIDSPEADAGLKRMSQSESKNIGQRAQEALARKASKTTP